MPETGTGFGPIVIAIVRSSWEVLLLRSGPQALPRSRLALYGLMSAYLAVDLLLAAVQGYDAVSVVLQSLLDTGIWVVGYAVLLGLKAALPRLDQTLSAWYGASTLLMLVSLPLAFAERLPWGPEAQLPIFILELTLLGWSMMVVANLLRHAIRVDLVSGFVIGFAFVAADQTILYLNFSRY